VFETVPQAQFISANKFGSFLAPAIVITTIFARTGSFELTKKYGQTLVESTAIERLTVDEEIFSQSWEFFKRMGEIGLSFTDSTSAVLMKKREISAIFTFDEHLKKLGLNAVP
jgi:predicted nucleic acid-binding protein